MKNNYDVVVIGGGPGGYVSAIRAAQLKMSVALVEAEHLGGICLNWGCIPTKALLRSAEIYRFTQHISDYGLSAKSVHFDIGHIVERSRKVSSQLAGGVKKLLAKNQVAVYEGRGSLLSANKVLVSKDDKKLAELEAKNVILATGARARNIPILEVDGKLVWDYKNALLPKSVPESMLVVGSGAIGMEFACFYHTFGTKVTVIEVNERILGCEDEEISNFAYKIFGKQGIEFYTGAILKNVKPKGKNGITVTIDNKGKIIEKNFACVISAVGVVGNIENLGLEHVKVKTDKGSILVDKHMQTNVQGVYAIGDVASTAPRLAHKASHEGIMCIEHIAGIQHHGMNRYNIPACTYTLPNIASVGLTEAQAKSAGYEIRVGRFPYIANGKAIAMSETDGLIKTIFDTKTGELLGAHIIGAEAVEMIQGFTLAKTMEATELDIMHNVFPHPTLSEMMHESVLAAYGRAIHI